MVRNKENILRFIATAAMNLSYIFFSYILFGFQRLAEARWAVSRLTSL